MSIFFSCFSFFFTFISPSQVPVLETETIEVQFKFNSPCNGQILMSCFQSGANFRESDKAIYSEVIACTESVQIENVDPQKRRSVIAFIDENKNEELDLNFFGIPTEPYAISNGFRGKWKEPDFEDSAEPIDSKTIVLEFNYWKHK